METPTPLSDLLQRFHAGDREAGDRLFSHFSKKLAPIAAQYLSRKLAAREGDEDVVQSALRTFYRRYRDGRFRVDSSAGLWRLLVQITIRKAQAKGRFHTARSRNIRAEETAPDITLFAAKEVNEPGPAEAAALVEQMEILLKGRPSEDGAILQMLIERRTKSEIARELGISRTTVHRVHALLRQRLERSLASQR
jgi:RNA polymerase sigma factor (sigma-70 family)